MHRASSGTVSSWFLVTFFVLAGRLVSAARPESQAVDGHLDHAEQADQSKDGGMALSTAKRLVMLSARGVSQISKNAALALAAISPASLAAPAPAQAAEEKATAPSALLDVEAPDEAPETLPASCGEFGGLNDKMTVVDVDADGGCVAGQQSDSVFVHFVGGTVTDCKPPEPLVGCHRFVIARYSTDCDLAPLQNMMRERNTAYFQDGVFKECYEDPKFQGSTMLFKGAPGMSQCNVAFCDSNTGKPSRASRCAGALLAFSTVAFSSWVMAFEEYY